MRNKGTKSIEINFHVGKELFSKMSVLQDAGLNSSAIARLAIRKCSESRLDEESESAFPQRLLLYLHADEAKLLDELAAKQGDRLRAHTLRRLIATYLRIHSSSIEALF
ncbi:MAG: hypothetical protein A2076_06620 [Geobacteraceae bacterium GWC2_53_11]|nr:MAG: hypothetical protein A2076_06620 [Geobacteraceae bacterium GWC2_53_11]